MNMLALAWFGGPLEEALGRARFLGLYLASGIAGSAGALLLSPEAATVGASGAIFGVFGAGFVLERSGRMVFGGQALGIIVLNLVITFALPGISLGGHVGGLVGGALVMIALMEFRRSTVLSAVSVVAVATASVVIAYWKVRGYT
jgi:membrane associated rhomboid family serine protease